MNFPLTITMRKPHCKVFRATVTDENAFRYVAAEILRNWKKGYSLMTQKLPMGDPQYPVARS